MSFTHRLKTEVNAMKFDGSNFDSINEMIGGLATTTQWEAKMSPSLSMVYENVNQFSNVLNLVIIIDRGEGDSERAKVGDYIVKQGNFIFSMPAKQFENMYEAIV